MTKKANSHHHIGHHMPLGPAGIEIRIHEDERGYYASTIYNPGGACPADIGPFETSRQAAIAGFERHGLEFDGGSAIVSIRRAYFDVAPSLENAMVW